MWLGSRQGRQFLNGLEKLIKGKKKGSGRKVKEMEKLVTYDVKLGPVLDLISTASALHFP